MMAGGFRYRLRGQIYGCKQIFYSAIAFLIFLLSAYGSADPATDITTEDETNTVESTTVDLFYLEEEVNNSFSANETDIINNVTDIINNVTDTSTTEISAFSETTTTIAKTASEWTDDSAETRIQDEDLCICDLASNKCEINCCCDPDCDDEDVKVFTECLSQRVFVDERYCYRTNIFYKNNAIYKDIVDPENQLFCVIRDNFKQRFRFSEVPSYEVVQDFEELTQTETYSWNLTEYNALSHASVKAGSVLLIKSNTVYLKPWSLLSHCFSKTCDCHEPVLYLEDKTTSCLLTINDLEIECEQNEMLSAKFYLNFCIEQFPSSNSSNADLLKRKDEFNDTKEYSDIIQESDSNCLTEHKYKKPTFDKPNKICNNVVSSVHYIVVHTGINGISHTIATIQYEKISLINKTISQRFSIAFKWNDTDSENIVKRSGNPGYQVGRPLIAGKRLNTTDKTVEQSYIKILENGLTILNSDSSGTCSHVRKTVKFGQNLKVGCVLKTIFLSCREIQERILKFLVASLERPAFIASFGNPDTNKSKDWIEIFYEGITPDDIDIVNSDKTDICNLILRLQIDVAFAAVGSSFNPQFKVVGIVFRYQSKQSVCCISVESTLQLATSVNFFDVSKLAVPVYKSTPIFKAKLPHDFFYPFLLSSATNLSGDFVLTVSLIYVILKYFS